MFGVLEEHKGLLGLDIQSLCYLECRSISLAGRGEYSNNAIQFIYLFYFVCVWGGMLIPQF